MARDFTMIKIFYHNFFDWIFLKILRRPPKVLKKAHELSANANWSSSLWELRESPRKCLNYKFERKAQAIKDSFDSISI